MQGQIPEPPKEWTDFTPQPVLQLKGEAYWRNQTPPPVPGHVNNNSEKDIYHLLTGANKTAHSLEGSNSQYSKGK